MNDVTVTRVGKNGDRVRLPGYLWVQITDLVGRPHLARAALFRFDDRARVHAAIEELLDDPADAEEERQLAAALEVFAAGSVEVEEKGDYW